MSSVLEILTDKSARAAYDRVLKARKEAELRNRELDSKRRKLKDDLERREREADASQRSRRQYNAEKSPEELLKDEVERLRKEGSRLVQEEQELMQRTLAEERLKMMNPQPETAWSPGEYRIKVKWTAEKRDPNNGGYTEEKLRRFLNKYGDIVVLVLSPKKTGSALVEFKTREAAEMAVAYEKGDMSNPLTIEWVSEPPKARGGPGTSSLASDNDYESLVLRKMRQAEERKRLIEQMMKDEQE